MPQPVSFYKSSNRDFTLVNGDSLSVLDNFKFKFDMIFADPPYFLSNGGQTIASGKIVSVDKGEWDKAGSREEVDGFNKRWISLCREKLKENGTIWISGTLHNIFSVGKALEDAGFQIINVITWKKTNPPHNIYDTHFQYASELIVLAKKRNAKVSLNVDWIKHENNGRMMNDVWTIPAVRMWEKSCGKHPTQKPLALLRRIILSSTQQGDWILDPFSGSGTTGIAASLYGRRFLGIEQDVQFCSLAKRRREDIEELDIYHVHLRCLEQKSEDDNTPSLIREVDKTPYLDLPF